MTEGVFLEALCDRRGPFLAPPHHVSPKLPAAHTFPPFPAYDLLPRPLSFFYFSCSSCLSILLFLRFIIAFSHNYVSSFSCFARSFHLPRHYGSFFSPTCFRTSFSSPQSSSTHLSLSSPPSLRPALPPSSPFALPSHHIASSAAVMIQPFPRPRDRPQRVARQQRGFHGGLYSPWLPFSPRGSSSQVGAWLLLQRLSSWRGGSPSQLHGAPAPAASSASHGAFGPLVALRGDAGGNTGGER